MKENPYTKFETKFFEGLVARNVVVSGVCVYLPKKLLASSAA